MLLGYLPVISRIIIFLPSNKLKVLGAAKCSPYFKYSPDQETKYLPTSLPSRYLCVCKSNL